MHVIILFVILFNLFAPLSLKMLIGWRGCFPLDLHAGFPNITFTLNTLLENLKEFVGALYVATKCYRLDPAQSTKVKP